MASVALVYSTHPSAEQARLSADALINSKLAACCTILPGAESHYVWNGAREQSAEWVMLSKVPCASATIAMETLRQMHPYECPAILQVGVDGGNPAFVAWVEKTIETTR